MQGVLFDLDGTLADTAADLADALNHVLIENHKPPLTFAKIRPMVSHGGIALIRLGFKIEPEEANFEALRVRLLAIYQQAICEKTQLFPGLNELLVKLENLHIPWGIVTNKPDWLSEPLIKKLNLQHRLSSLVCGNTLSQRKPHPAPLLHACKQMQLEPQDCIYIGDAARDIEAGKRAGMKTIAAAYGYIEKHDPPKNWQADILVEHSENLWQTIKPLLNIGKKTLSEQ